MAGVYETTGVSSLGEAFAKDASNIGSNVKSIVSSTFGQTNDNIVIPSDTKTLLGDDFSSLYTDIETKDCQASDGSTLTAIESNCSYDTEMHSGMCSVGSSTSYSLLSDKEKAMYELTLLSKKYSSQWVDGADDTNNSLADEYGAKVAEYKAYCEQNGISWTDVCTGVSVELQTECADYLDANNHVFNNDSISDIDNNRIITNRAHSMLISCASLDGYTDELYPGAENYCEDISYEDTLDTTPHAQSFLSRIADAFAAKWEVLKENWPHPIKALKLAFFTATDELDAIDQQEQSESAERVNEYNDRASEMITQVDELKNEQIDKTNERLEQLSNYASENGLITDESSEEDMSSQQEIE